MKTKMIPTHSFSLTRAMTALLLLTAACDRDEEALLVDRAAVECSPEGEGDCELTEAEMLAFSKEIVVSDGYNRVTLLVASDDHELVEDYDEDSFEIAPVFERPEVGESSESDGEGGGGDGKTPSPAYDSSHSVLIEERSVSLEDGAIGYELREAGFEARPTPKMCYAPSIYVSSAHFVKLDVTSAPCTMAQISKRLGSWGPWVPWVPWVPVAFEADQCQGDPTFMGGSLDARHLRLEVCQGPTRVVTFFN